jgi:hypothetical protein
MRSTALRDRGATWSRRLAEVAALRDISVVEPDIEDVVARLYTGRAPDRGREAVERPRHLVAWLHYLWLLAHRPDPLASVDH